MKNLQTKIFFLFFSLIILSCNKTTKLERENEPTIYETESGDTEMNTARKEAVKTLSQFYKAFESNDSKLTAFSIKQTFGNQDYNEHIWLIFCKRPEYQIIVSIVMIL